MDVYRHGDSFYICLDLPGIDPGSIDLTVEQNVLTVRAERTPVQADGARIAIVPTAALSASPRLDVLFVPGGFGHVPLLTDDELEHVYVALEWAAGQGYTWMRPRAEREYKMPTLRQASTSRIDSPVHEALPLLMLSPGL